MSLYTTLIITTSLDICINMLVIGLNHVCWISLLLWSPISVTGQFNFVLSPGVKRTLEGDSVDLTWKLSHLEIVDGGEIEIGTTRILEYNFGQPLYKNGYTSIKAPFTFDTTAKTIAVRMNSVNRTSDAGQYSCRHTSFSTDGSRKTDNDAVIYVYGKPNNAIIGLTFDTIIEGENQQLRCESQSTSVPAAYRPEPPITYRWYRNDTDITLNPPERHNMSLNRLLITGVQRGDAASRYSCQAEETGGLQSDVSSSVQIDLLYTPGQGQLLTEASVVEEGVDLNLTCNINDPGNPPAYTYHWVNLDTGFTKSTVTRHILVPSSELLAEDHAGRWQCWAENSVGTGPASASVDIYINGPPGKPSNPKLISRTAVRLTLSWTAGYNGGYKQTFTVMYRPEGSDVELSAAVDHQSDVSAGDAVVYKLMDPDTISPDTEYSIRIRSHNSFQGTTYIYGETAQFQTKVSPLLIGLPAYSFTQSQMIITAGIAPIESVTHILSTLCSNIEAPQCTRENISVAGSVVTISHSLPDTSTKVYQITVIMYDGEDAVNTYNTTVQLPKATTPVYWYIVTGVLAVALASVSVILIYICIRRKQDLKKSRNQSSVSRCPITYQNTPGGTSPAVISASGPYEDISPAEYLTTDGSSIPAESHNKTYVNLDGDQREQTVPSVYEMIQK